MDVEPYGLEVVAVNAVSKSDNSNIMSARRISIYCLISILLFVVCAYLGSFSFYIKSIVSILLYFTVYVLLCRNLDSTKYIWVVLAILGIIPFAVYTFIHATNFNESIGALPSSYAFLLGLGFAVLWQSKLRKISIIIPAVIITPIYSILLTDQLLQYSDTSEVITGESRDLSQIKCTDSTGKIITTELLKHEILVINFWNTGCGVCKREFPRFNEIIAKYNDQPRVKIVSINVPLPRDSGGQAWKYVLTNKYSFPVYFLSQQESLSKFGITSFPTLLLIRNGKDVELINDINDLENEINEALIQ